MIDINNLSNGLMGFYIVGALVLLAIAIVAYPTLSDRSRKSSRK